MKVLELLAKALLFILICMLIRLLWLTGKTLYLNIWLKPVERNENKRYSKWSNLKKSKKK